MRYSGEQKTRGQRADKAADTWRRFWPHGQRVSREVESLRASCCVYPVRGETTAADNDAKYTTVVQECQIGRGMNFAIAPSWQNQNIARNAGEYTTLHRTCQALFEANFEIGRYSF